MPRARERMLIHPHLDEVAVVRLTFGRWLAARGVGDRDRRDLELIVTELTTNAIEASPAPTAIEIAMEHEDNAVSISVANCGREPSAFGPGTDGDAMRERGRGLQIVRALTEGVRTSYDPPVTVVSCRRQLVA